MKEKVLLRTERSKLHEVDGIHTGVVEFADNSAIVACYTPGDVVRIGSHTTGEHGSFGYPQRYSVNADLPVSRAEADELVGIRGNESHDYNYYRAVVMGGHRADGLPVFIYGWGVCYDLDKNWSR